MEEKLKERLKTSVFTLAIGIWFLTAIYISLNSIVNLFIKNDPYIAKWILMVSFLISVIMGMSNRSKSGDFFISKEKTKKTKDLKDKKAGCGSCKKK